jgi:hypothetical protein
MFLRFGMTNLISERVTAWVAGTRDTSGELLGLR